MKRKKSMALEHRVRVEQTISTQQTSFFFFTFVDNSIQNVFANIGSDYTWPSLAHQDWMWELDFLDIQIGLRRDTHRGRNRWRQAASP